MKNLKKTIKTKTKSDVEGMEVLALIISIFYAHSVNTNLHHYMYWRTIEHPVVIFLIAPLVLIMYTTQKNNRLSRLGVAVLAVLLTASFIWLSGFRVNAVRL